MLTVGIRFGTLLTVVACLCPAQTSWERLAATTKLWVYVKYFHPRVTAADVDWDGAFATTAPKVLNAKTDEEFAAALGKMLGALNDPGTLVTQSPAGQFEGPIFTVKKNDAGVTVVRLEKADVPRAVASRNSLYARLAGAGPVVFDLRGAKVPEFFFPVMLPVSKAVPGVSLMTRRHDSYASPRPGGNQYHSSSWDSREAVKFAAVPGSNRLVFLVNRATTIPLIALAIQDSGAGAIVSEDPIVNEQVNLSRSLDVLGNVRAVVRTKEISYQDGTTGTVANVVLHQRGDLALQAAADIATSGNWPAPPQRAKLNLASANFAEKGYSGQPYPGREYRMLAAARIWGVFHYFHPYKHLYDRDWDTVLVEFLEKLANAESKSQYQFAVAEMVSHNHDSHSTVSLSGELFDGAVPTGVEVRWIENQPVVTRVLDPSLQETVRPGDVLIAINGEPVERRIAELPRYVSASTPQAMMNTVMMFLLWGPDGTEPVVSFRTRGESKREVPIRRSLSYRGKFRPRRTGEIFRLVNPKLGYVDLERLPNDQVDAMFDMFSNTDAIIMDMRGGAQETARAIAGRLAQKSVLPSPEFHRNLVTADTFDGNPVTSIIYRDMPTRASNKPRYRGKTVMLMDERTGSQSEHSGMEYRAANGTIFIGSPTQGVDGEATIFLAPGGITIGFSTCDVRWPDGKQLQRVGLQPDIEVRQTIEGIRAGRDEVLERAISYLTDGR